MTEVAASRPRAHAPPGAPARRRIQGTQQEGDFSRSQLFHRENACGCLCVPCGKTVPQQPNSICDAFCCEEAASCLGRAETSLPPAPLSETPLGDARPTCPRPRAADTSDCKLGGFKTAAFVLWPLWRPDVRNRGVSRCLFRSPWGHSVLGWRARHSRPCLGLPVGVSPGVSSPHLIRTPDLGAAPPPYPAWPPLPHMSAKTLPPKAVTF